MSFRRDIICSLYSMTAGVGLFFWLLLEFPEQIISLNPPENFLRIFVKFLGISIGTGMLLGFIATRLISSKWVVSLRRFVICSLCLMIVGVGLSIWRLLEFPEQIIPVSPPQSLAAMLLRCLGIWIAAGLFFGLAVELFFNLWRMQVLPKRRTLLVIGAPLAVYIGIYLVTTTVRLQGQGGLSGPLKVRVFASERHLIAFYPLYLVERWIRNASFVDAVYYFNVDFKDAYYPHPWLYDDGVYGLIWYDF